MALNDRAVARRTIAAVAAALPLLLTGCGGSTGATGGGTGGGKQSAADFIREVTTQFSRGQTGRLWDTLHPADQAVVSRARYTACQSNAGFDLKSFKVLETYTETVDLGGKAVPSTAVSIRATSEDGVTTATMHAVPVASTWRWILSPADYRAYRQGTCPSSA